MYCDTSGDVGVRIYGLQVQYDGLRHSQRDMNLNDGRQITYLHRVSLVGPDPPSLLPSVGISFVHQAVSPLGIVLYYLLQSLEVQLAHFWEGKLLSSV